MSIYFSRVTVQFRFTDYVPCQEQIKAPKMRDFESTLDELYSSSLSKRSHNFSAFFGSSSSYMRTPYYYFNYFYFVGYSEIPFFIQHHLCAGELQLETVPMKINFSWRASNIPGVIDKQPFMGDVGKVINWGSTSELAETNVAARSPSRLFTFARFRLSVEWSVKEWQG